MPSTVRFAPVEGRANAAPVAVAHGFSGGLQALRPSAQGRVDPDWVGTSLTAAPWQQRRWPAEAPDTCLCTFGCCRALMAPWLAPLPLRAAVAWPMCLHVPMHVWLLLHPDGACVGAYAAASGCCVAEAPDTCLCSCGCCHALMAPLLAPLPLRAAGVWLMRLTRAYAHLAAATP